MSYPPGPDTPYGQQPGYGQQQPQQPGYGFPQQQAGYGYPQAPQQAGYGYSPMAAPAYAGWWNRVAATLVDSLITAVPYWILLFLAGSMHNGLGTVLALVGVLYAIGMGLYLVYLEGTTGQSIGKKVVNIRVLREADGQVLGFGMAFVRRLAHVLDALPCYLGFLWPAWDAKKQTFADKVCNTVVVASA